MATVSLKQIRKAFGDLEIIKGVDLEIEDNEFVVFVGPSGCGKSTLLRLIAGLEDITGGDLTIDDTRVNDTPPSERGIAMVFQSYALYPHMSVRDNMAFSLKLAKADKAEMDAKVNEAADILQLTPLLDRKPKELSGGQRQRVAIGRAIVRNPKVFLFDEPLSNLDAALRVQMRIEIARLHNELDATMIYVTHDQIEAMTMADKIVVLNAGRVEQVGSPLELYHHPRNLFVAGFIGSPKMNFMDASVVANEAESATVELPGGDTITIPVRGGGLTKGQKLTLGVRPEHMAEGEGGDAKVTGEVFVVERLGGETYLYIRGITDDVIVLQAEGSSMTKVGDTISIALKAELCHLFTQDGLVVEPVNRNKMADITRKEAGLLKS